MNYCEQGKVYSFYGVPLAFRGEVEKETATALFLKKGTVERYHTDSPSITAELRGETQREKIPTALVIEKCSGLCIFGPH